MKQMESGLVPGRSCKFWEEKGNGEDQILLMFNRVCATALQHMALYELFAHCSLARDTKDDSTERYVPGFN